MYASGIGADMPNLQLLNAHKHSQLRLRHRAGPDPHFVQLVVGEFVAAAACCPIFLTKNAQNGEFYVGAMFGFRAGETLLEDAEVRAGFQPLVLQKEGFFTADENIAIDADHERFSLSQGEPLFDEDKSPGTHLRHIQRVLGHVHAGIKQTESFIQTLSTHKLIEPIDISLSFVDGERFALQGLYTASLDAFRELDDAIVLQLVRAGYAQLIYAMNVSLQQVSRLAALRNRRVRAERKQSA
jgi:hypothetical protein